MWLLSYNRLLLGNDKPNLSPYLPHLLGVVRRPRESTTKLKFGPSRLRTLANNDTPLVETA